MVVAKAAIAGPGIMKASAPTASQPAASVEDKSAKVSKDERMKRFKELCLRRNEARNANRSEVAAEDQRSKTSTHEVAKREKAQQKLDEQIKRREVEVAGGDYDREICLDVDQATSQRWHKKSQKAEKDKFIDHRTGGVRKYERQMDKFKPDLEKYEKRKIAAALNEDAALVSYGGEGKVEKEDMDRLAQAFGANAAKKVTRSRRKEFFAEADVDYINSQNERFNAKLRRAYDVYTKDIKSNLERGTAL